MKRSAIDLSAIADWNNLTAAFHRAALGKTNRAEVRLFRAGLYQELAALREDILAGEPRLSPMRSFQILDPKARLIHAPVFRDRVLHHALIAHIGPVLERSLIFDTYACRVGKGTIAAVRRVQHFARRFAWYGQIDIRSYFPNIDHGILKGLLERRFKNRELLRFLSCMIATHGTGAGKGLPIGALTSQHFANLYLDGCDRFLLEGCKVRGMVRYMDDTVWWGDSKEAVRSHLSAAADFLRDRLGLEIKQPVRIGRSARGISYCGFRVLPGAILLSRRRRRRYAAVRARWERAFERGQIDSCGLQAGYASALGMTAASDCIAWRREQLRRVPLGSAVACA
ncbi:MAG: reverse transcriptase domain-containing protein [Rhodomicrobium sp.]